MKFNLINVALLSFSASAFSLGMGDLEIKSHLNQPFHGEIKLIDVGNIPLSGIQASVASLSDFERIGLNYDDDLDKLKLNVKKNKKGEPVIVITSFERINEPYLELVVDLAWANGQLYRAYTLLLDPPKYEITTAVGQRTSSLAYGKSTKQKGAIEKEVYRDKTVLPKQDDVNRPESTYGPTTGKEDIYQIAQRYVTPNTTVQQVILGINGVNQSAFKQGNINGLLAGKILKIPSNDDVEQIPRDLAIKEIAAQDKAWANKEPIDHVLIPPYTKGIVIAPDVKHQEISKPKQPMPEDLTPEQDQSHLTEINITKEKPETSETKALPDKATEVPEPQDKSKQDKDEGSALLFNLSPDSILPTIAGHGVDQQPKPSDKSKTQPTIKQPEPDKQQQDTVADSIDSKETMTKEPALTSDADPNSVSALKQQLSVLKESNQKLNEKMAQRDKDIAQLKQQLTLLMKSRQGIAGQSASPTGQESEIPWIWILIALIALSAGAGGYYYREQLQSLYQRRGKDDSDRLEVAPEEEKTTKTEEDEFKSESQIVDVSSDDTTSQEDEGEGSVVARPLGIDKQSIETRDTKTSAPTSTTISPEDIERELSEIQDSELKIPSKAESIKEEENAEVSVKISRKTEEQQKDSTEKDEEELNFDLDKSELKPSDDTRISKDISTSEKQLSDSVTPFKESIEEADKSEEALKMEPEEVDSLEIEPLEIATSEVTEEAEKLVEGETTKDNEDEGLTFEKVDIETPKAKPVASKKEKSDEEENLLEFDIDTDAIFASSDDESLQGKDSELKAKDGDQMPDSEEQTIDFEDFEIETKEQDIEPETAKTEVEEPEIQVEEPEAKVEEHKAEEIEEREVKVDEEKEPQMLDSKKDKKEGSKAKAKKAKEKSKKQEIDEPVIDLTLEEPTEEFDQDSKAISTDEVDTEENEHEFSLTDLVESATGHTVHTDHGSGHKKLVKSKKAMETLLSLAETYITMGDKDSARQSLEEVLEYGDDNQKKAAKKLLNSL